MKRVVRSYVRRDSPACTARASETPAYARKDGFPRLVIPESARILVTVRILLFPSHTLKNLFNTHTIT